MPDEATASAKAPPPKVEPKARIPLDEVEVIAFERAFDLSGRFIGQPNLDFTMPGAGDAKDKDGRQRPVAKADDVLAPPPGTVAAAKIPKLEPKPNGIRDLHLTLSSLRAAAIKQVTINAQTDKGPTTWRLDTTDSHDWPLVLRRAGTESWADLFLEPPAGRPARRRTSRSTSPTRTARTPTPTPRPTSTPTPSSPSTPRRRAPSLDARVYLTGDEKLFGKLEGIGAESLRLHDALARPARRAAGARRRRSTWGCPTTRSRPSRSPGGSETRGTEDLLLARTKDGEVVAIPGIVEGTEGDKLRFHYQDKTRTLSAEAGRGPGPRRAAGARAARRAAADLLAGRRPRRLGPLEGARHQDLEGRDRLGPGARTSRPPRSAASGSAAAR